MVPVAESLDSQTKPELEINSRIMDLFLKMEFLDKMEILEVKTIDFYEIGLETMT